MIPTEVSGSTASLTYCWWFKKKRRTPADIEKPQSLVWFVQVSYNYPLVIWILSTNSINEHVLLLWTLFDPRVCESIAWVNPFRLVISTHLKNISQIGNLPQVGVKIKNVSNHHLDNFLPPPAGWFCGKQNTPGVLWAQKTQHTTLLLCSQRLRSLFPLRVFFVDFPSAAMRVLVAFFWLPRFLGIEELWKRPIPTRSGKRAKAGRPLPTLPSRK